MNRALLDELFQLPLFDQADDLLSASKNGRLDIVERLLEDQRVDPSDQNNISIIFASENGHLDVVERLLQDERVDPSSQDNQSIILASENGHLGVVERLLQDRRVDPSDQNNEALRVSLEYKKVANLLLNNINVRNHLIKQG